MKQFFMPVGILRSFGSNDFPTTEIQRRRGGCDFLLEHLNAN